MKTLYYEYQKIGNCLFLEEVEPVITNGNITRMAIFECICGNKFIAAISNVKQNKIISCKCIQDKRRTESHTKHGQGSKQTRSIEYITWINMKQRCYNPNASKYKEYGSRGIKVCDRWLNSFENFLIDMGIRPEKTFTLDRLDNNGPYCKENCKWASKTDQAINRRTTILITHKGITKPLYHWMSELKIGKKKALALK